MAADPAGQPAVTRFRVLGSSDGLAWLELAPETGRTHQLRVHCAAEGFPVLGDAVYGRDSIRARSAPSARAVDHDPARRRARGRHDHGRAARAYARDAERMRLQAPLRRESGGEGGTQSLARAIGRVRWGREIEGCRSYRASSSSGPAPPHPAGAHAPATASPAIAAERNSIERLPIALERDHAARPRGRSRSARVSRRDVGERAALEQHAAHDAQEVRRAASTSPSHCAHSRHAAEREHEAREQDRRQEEEERHLHRLQLVLGMVENVKPTARLRRDEDQRDGQQQPAAAEHRHAEQEARQRPGSRATWM